jgi:protein gp37
MRAYINGLQDDWRNRLLRAALNVLQAYAFEGGESWPWPLSNVWLGVSVEDQRRADLRVPDLLATPAAVRFVSCEPLLGPVDLSDIVNVIGPGDTWHIDALDHIEAALCRDEPGGLPALDWVIAGGESGPKARPMDPDWARSLRDQCAGTGTAFLFKQWGRKSAGRELDGRTWDEYPKA